MVENYQIVIWWDEDDGCYIADIPELEGCMAHGDTPQQAEEEIKIAAKMWLETATEYGEEIPKPRKYVRIKECVA